MQTAKSTKDNGWAKLKESPERIAKYNANRRAAYKRMTPEQRDIRRVKCRLWSEANPDKMRLIEFRNNINQKYGLRYEQWQEMVKTCRNLCEICGEPPSTGKRLHIDHCHTTNKVRGLLCNRCNSQLHSLDNTDWRKKAEAYLALRG